MGRKVPGRGQAGAVLAPSVLSPVLAGQALLCSPGPVGLRNASHTGSELGDMGTRDPDFCTNSFQEDTG